MEREGLKIQQVIEDKTVKILKENGFDKDGKPLELKDTIKMLTESDLIPETLVNQAVLEYNESKDKELQIEISELHDTFENPIISTNASIDEVGVKKQKEEGRSKYSAKKDGKEYVRNTVVHVHKWQDRYILNKLGIIPALKILMAFLLYNNLLAKGALVFNVVLTKVTAYLWVGKVDKAVETFRQVKR